MTLSTKLLILLIAIGALFFGGYYEGSKHATDAARAAQLVAERKAETKYRAEVTRGNQLSARLAESESTIHIKTVEVIKHVPQVTTGRRCLDPDAVSLLNGSGIPRLSAAAGQPAAADAATPAASDTDVANWIASANGQYDLCAARLNGLVDFEEAKP